MRFAVAAVAAGLAGSAVAQNATASDVYVTEVVTAFTTFCPEATMLTHGGSTYTVSSATTLTITHCPGGCTITKPVYSSVYTSCSGASCSSSPAAPVSMSSSMSAPASVKASASSAPVAPAPYTSMMTSMASAGVPYPSSNGSSPAAPYSSGAAAGTGSGSKPSSTAAPYTGAAGKAYAATGAGVLALFGLVAAL